MIVLDNREAIERSPSLPLAPELRDLLASRVRHLSAGEHNLADSSVFIVVEPGDREADLVSAVGFSPLVNPIDGARWGSAAYVHWVDYVHRASAGIFEVIVTIGNDGFGIHVLIPDVAGIDADLLSWCEEMAA